MDIEYASMILRGHYRYAADVVAEAEAARDQYLASGPDPEAARALFGPEAPARYGRKAAFAAAVVATAALILGTFVAPLPASVMDEEDAYCLDPRMLAAMGLDWPESGFAGAMQPPAAEYGNTANNPYRSGSAVSDAIAGTVQPGSGDGGAIWDMPTLVGGVRPAPGDPVAPIPLPGALWALLSGLGIVAGLGGLRRS